MPHVGKKRVAVLIGDLQSSGGIQRVAANLMATLNDHYEMILLSVDPTDRPVFVTPDMDVRYLGCGRPYGKRTRFLKSSIKFGLALRRFVKENRIDVVLAIWPDLASVAAVALPRDVVTIGCEHIAFSEPPRPVRKLRHRTYRYLDAVASLTEVDAPRYRKISRRVEVIPNAVSAVERSAFESREKMLLTIGHVIYRKGYDRLLWALQKPLLDHPDWKLTIVGGGEVGHVDWGFLGHLVDLTKALGLEGQVQFRPSTPDINSFYRRAAISVMGSRMEGLPMTLIEAKAHGLPTISFDCETGPREIIRDGVDGYLIANKTELFAEAAERLIADTELRRQMGVAAYEDASGRYSNEAVVRQWVSLIDSCLAAKSH
ncbi:Glycosyltransferase involved in cell wall bisynthesis [Faunimonas pinastri]|uniref:Glycosyltransferase involved in cell wall bisynthesis n=1 Tax=Faunimonas pinastri TaxID=1855383 RepID=A0A1H9CNN0_9HYPH|nr:glycosyltransferase family 4 protein [Faunimonas pinastri]SEQ02764.1 Glycosyltransferase involved in cell wall bisynthesis [Faunimonas pinastri]